MLTVVYYALMLLLGFVVYRHGQKLLKQGFRDENDQITKPPMGPVSFVVCGAVACVLLFGVLRALVQGQIECVGKGCAGQVYTLAENAGRFWGNVFFLVWCVLALGYGMYVSFRIWSKD